MNDASTGAIIGRVHSVETAGTVDGPGLRFVVFLAGCPLRCLYCHNPDTRDPAGGVSRTVDALMAEILSYKDFLQRSGGGVTVSGGEPLAQPAFVTALFHACHRYGLSTALDTSGCMGAKVADALLDATDLVLLDIKAFDDDAHRRVTGAPLAPCLAFAEKLARRHQRMWVRYVLVPGLTDDLPSIERLAAYVARLGSVERVEVLPFHKMGEPKWAELGLPYTLGATQLPSPDLLTRVQTLFRNAGLTTV
jgi:pyruvate formate lyase activating enzyme